MQFVGANTLIYFALNGKVYAVIKKVLGRFSFYSSWLENDIISSIVAIGIAIVMFVMLVLPAMIINGCFPWVLGGKRN